MASLLSPIVLSFGLGVIAARLKSDLRFPDSLYASLTIYLMIAIGMKGGYKLSITPFPDFLLPAAAAILLSTAIPLWSYWILRKAGKFDRYNSAALAAHYGSVSAVTFSAAIAFQDGANLQHEGFMPGLLAIMEIPAILVAIMLTRINVARGESKSVVPLREIFKELLVGKGSVLLFGFLVIGFVSGQSGWEQVAPLFDIPFKGVLTLFLLEAGLVAGRKLSDLNGRAIFLIAFALAMPVIHACIGITLGKYCGLSEGGSAILGILAASASYIAAPAACRVALPEANPSYYITAALAVTFPFNLTVGIPLYHSIASLLYN
jgi:uncharacterized protein